MNTNELFHEWCIKEGKRLALESRIRASGKATMPEYCRAYEIMGVGVKEVCDFCDYLRDETNVKVHVNKSDLLMTEFSIRVIDIYFDKCFTHVLDESTGAFNERKE